MKPVTASGGVRGGILIAEQFVHNTLHGRDYDGKNAARSRQHSVNDRGERWFGGPNLILRSPVFNALPEMNGSTSAAASVRPRRVQPAATEAAARSEEHTSELQSHLNLVCRLLLEKKKHSQFRLF